MDSDRLKALELARGRNANAREIERVAALTSTGNAAWAFTQWRLRERAKAKFASADSMLFDADGLEMASHEAVAAYHATRFPRGARVADLTVGIGADLIALARGHEVVGYELDPERAELAEANLKDHGLSAEIRRGDCLAGAWDFQYAFADPSRRPGGKRTLDPSTFEPPPAVLAERMRSFKLGLIKLSPMLADSALESFGGPVEFVSFAGECREALLSLGVEAGAGGVEAVRVESGARLAGGTEIGPEDAIPRTFMFEADPAAIRAHALGTLCKELGLRGLGDSNGYLTGDRPVESEWITGFRVVWAGSADKKATRVVLRSLGAHIEAVKSRAQGVDVQGLPRRLGQGGARALILVVYPVGPSRRYVLVERQPR